MTVYFGYIGALFIGLVLGLTGGGGSILTVPVLVYLMGLHPVTATAYSLFIVGTTSAFGTVQNIRKGIVEVKTAFLFAIPSFTAVFVTRRFIIPIIPEIIFENDTIAITKGLFLMVLFAVIMFLAALSMLKANKQTEADTRKPNVLLSVIQIFCVGIVIGLVGAGGGFLIIPALVYLAKLPMRTAIGTSLLIIAINSLIGFTGDLGHIPVDWGFLLRFTAIAITGIFTGIYLNKFIDEKYLKKIFGWFVLAMAVFIFSKEIFF